MDKLYESILKEASKINTFLLDDLINSIEKDVVNKTPITTLKNKKDEKKAEIEAKLAIDPFKKYKNKYDEFKNGYFTRLLGLLNEFNYEGENLKPKESFDRLFQSVNDVYLTLLKRVKVTGESLSNTTPLFPTEKNYNFVNAELDYSLSDMIKSAEEVGKWVDYISTKNYNSKRSNFFKNRVNGKLSSFGISDPQAAPKDFKTAATYVARYVQLVANEKPKLYND